MALAPTRLGLRRCSPARPAAPRRCARVARARGAGRARASCTAASLRGLNRLSDRLHDIEVRDLRSRLAAVAGPGAARSSRSASPSRRRRGRLPGRSAADRRTSRSSSRSAVCALAARRGDRCRGGTCCIVLALSGVGFALADAYSLMGAAGRRARRRADRDGLRAAVRRRSSRSCRARCSARGAAAAPAQPQGPRRRDRLGVGRGDDARGLGARSRGRVPERRHGRAPHRAGRRTPTARTSSR